MRNVPERPYKCNQCPSSTFSTLSNLNKHLTSKHHGQMSEGASLEAMACDPRYKNITPQGPPNVTISPTFPINIPRNLSIIPQYNDALKLAGKNSFVGGKTLPITVPTIRVQEFANCNGTEKDPELEDVRLYRKRSSSDEPEALDKKRTSPDFLKVTSHETSDQGILHSLFP